MPATLLPRRSPQRMAPGALRSLAIAVLALLLHAPAHALTYQGTEVLRLEPTCTGSCPIAAWPDLGGAITPDGTAIIFTVRNTTGLADGTYRLDLATLAATPLPADTPLPMTMRTVSADGRFSVATETGLPPGSYASIIITDAVTGTTTRIPNTGYLIGYWQPVISADGSTVAFVAPPRPGSVPQIPLIYNRLTGELATLEPIYDTGVYHRLSLSDDGRRLAVTRQSPAGFGPSPVALWLFELADREAPTVSVRVASPILPFPSGGLVGVGLMVDARDDVGVARIEVAVTQDEPVHDPGDPRPDAVVSVGADGQPRLALRAERSDSGNGRVYLIEVIVTDTSGNRASAFTTVVVPRRLSFGSILSALRQGLEAQRAALPLPYDSESVGMLSSAG